MAAFHAVHAIFSAMPSAMPPLPQLGGYQAQPQQFVWPETAQPDMPQMSGDGSGFEDWSTWNWPQGSSKPEDLCKTCDFA
eukprot:g28073.t1